jgi:hypothetical protein
MTVEETLWFLIVGAVLVLSIASGERASSVLYFQKHVVDVELDRAVAFERRRLVLFVKASPDGSPSRSRNVLRWAVSIAA